VSLSKKHIFQCDCHDYHFMMFEWWPEDKKFAQVVVNAYVSIGGRDWDSLRKRVQAAWRMLRGKEYSYYEVVLGEEDAVSLRNALNEYIVFLARKSWLERLPGPDVSDWRSDEDSVYDSGPAVCVTHKRFIPCRAQDGCVISEDQGDVDAVRAYQSGEG
jgi:hypothetical protein